MNSSSYLAPLGELAAAQRQGLHALPSTSKTDDTASRAPSASETSARRFCIPRPLHVRPSAQASLPRREAERRKNDPFFQKVTFFPC